MKILFSAVFLESSTNYSQAIAFEQLGHSVVRFPYRSVAELIGLAQMSKRFNLVIDEEKPDLVIFSKCDEMSIETVSHCKGKCLSALWYMDPVEGGLSKRLADKARDCDIVFCSIWESFEVLKKINPNTFFLHEGYDHIQNYPVDIQQDIDVSFIGDLRGHRYNYHKAYNFNVINNAYGKEHSTAVSRSKINLNFTHGGCSDRVYKVLASKGFLLTEKWPHMEDDFEIGKDLDVFSGSEEMKDKIAYYLSHDSERHKIAECGFDTVQKFSRLEWARKILEKIEKV